MGTRSTYRVIETYKDFETKKQVKKNLVLVYVQYDGYPDGHPMETAEWLAGGKVVNGISGNDTGLIFNGAGCLAAQLIARLKSGPGGTYIYPINSRGNAGEDYLYDIVVDSDSKTITFIAYENYNRKKVLFSDNPQHFTKFLEEQNKKKE
jgi:hypothetical protein